MRSLMEKRLLELCWFARCFSLHMNRCICSKHILKGSLYSEHKNIDKYLGLGRILVDTIGVYIGKNS